MSKYTLSVFMVSNEVRSAVVNKPVGMEFNAIKVGCILLFPVINIRTKI